jgi:hypothetical protein
MKKARPGALIQREPPNTKERRNTKMARIEHASAGLRINSADSRSVCFINGANPAMTAENAVGFVEGIEELYNQGSVTARLSVVSNIVRT